MRRLILAMFLLVPALVLLGGWTAPTYYPFTATPWYDASLGGETAPMTEGVSDGVTYIYSTTASAGSKSFTVNVLEAGVYKISASVSAPDAAHNSWMVKIVGVKDANNSAETDNFAVKGIGQGFHEEDVTGWWYASKGTRYWNLTAGNVVVTWYGDENNAALACFRLVRVAYFPRPIQDAMPWMME